MQLGPEPDGAGAGDATSPPPVLARTVAELLRAREHDDRPGLHFADTTWTWRHVVAQSRRRAELAAALRPPGPFHIGVLLDNVPEYLLWLGAAACAGAAVVGINPTRRGAELARDIVFTDCGIVVTDEAGARLLEGLDLHVPPDRILHIDRDEYRTRLEGVRPPEGWHQVAPDDLLLLLFTSGTTGNPKAVRCTQRRLAAIAGRAAQGYGFESDDVCYCPMPLFHGNAIMALWAPALAVGASVALAGRFSASRFLADVRHFGATRFTYVGKALAYVLATPERHDDGDNRLRQGFGTEASAPDRAIFERRFGCRLVEGYGSSEGGTAINVTPDTPPGSLGVPLPTDDVAVIDPDTGRECERARFDAGGGLANAGTAIGEIVNRSGGATSRAITRTPRATPSGSGTTGTGPATSAIGTRPATSTSQAGAATGCGSTPRTSPPRPSSAWSSATPTSPPLRSTPCPTPAPVTRSWPPSSSGPGRCSTPTASPPSCGPRPTWGPNGRRASCGCRAACPSPPRARSPRRRCGPKAGPVPTRSSGARGAVALRYRLLTDDDRRALRDEFEVHGRSHLLGTSGAPALD